MYSFDQFNLYDYIIKYKILEKISYKFCNFFKLIETLCTMVFLLLKNLAVIKVDIVSFINIFE